MITTILLICWLLPAVIGLGLTTRELRKRHADMRDPYAWGGIFVCLFWPLAVPGLFFLYPLHQTRHVIP